MKIKVFKLNENGKIEIPLEELQALIDEAAEENKENKLKVYNQNQNENNSLYYPSVAISDPVVYSPNKINTMLY